MSDVGGTAVDRLRSVAGRLEEVGLQGDSKDVHAETTAPASTPLAVSFLREIKSL